MSDDLDAVARWHLAEARASYQAQADQLGAELATVRQKIRAIDEIMGSPPGAGAGGPGPCLPGQAARVELAPQPVAAGRDRAPQAELDRSELEAWAEKLKGLTHPQALVRIAQESGGTVRSADATRILVGIGHIKGRRSNASGHMHRLLRQSDRFVQTGVGTFRLVDAPPEAAPTALALPAPSQDGQDPEDDLLP